MHTVQSQKSNEEGERQKSAFVCNTELSQICNVCTTRNEAKYALFGLALALVFGGFFLESI